MCDTITGLKTVNLDDLRCKCGCDEIVARSYSKQHRWSTGHKTSYISVGILSCKKCGETLLEWSM
jgi:hypothetical protein